MGVEPPPLATKSPRIRGFAPNDSKLLSTLKHSRMILIVMDTISSHWYVNIEGEGEERKC